MGTSVIQLVREYLEQLAGKTDSQADAAEFERLSRFLRSVSAAGRLWRRCMCGSASTPRSFDPEPSWAGCGWSIRL
jgi:hypothetical protein